MKKLFYIICLVTSASLTAQILPVEQLKEVTNEDREQFYTQVQGITHIKDVNGVLNKFIGTWKGAFDGKQLEIVIKKYILDYSRYVNKDYHSGSLLWDQLVLKHKLTDQNGVVLANTLNLPDNDEYVMFKDAYHDSYTYAFNYFGKDYKCGDNGYVFIFIQDSTKAHFVYSHKGSQDPDCTNAVGPVFPKTTIVLTKQ